MSDYNKIISDLKKMVEKNTRDIEILNEILNVHEVPCDGFFMFKLSVDKIYNKQETNLTAEDLIDIQLFDSNSNILTNESGVTFTYTEDYIKVLLPNKANIRKLGVKSKRNDTNIVDEFSLFGSNDNKSFVKLAYYTDGYDLLIHDNFVYFDVPEYIMHDSIISSLIDEGNNINKYETMSEYDNDIFRTIPSVSEIKETSEIIYDN